MLAVPILALGVGAMGPAASATASDIQDGVDAGGKTGVNCLFTNHDTKDKNYCKSGVFTDIANTALFIIGALSVIMLIYGGIRYTISGGDSAAVTAAKNTILYAIVGLVVAILASAIVNYVLGQLIH